jgi:Rieske Fe-S protein
MTENITRRTLGGLAAAGVSVPLLAACSSDDGDSAADSGSTVSLSTGTSASGSSSGGGQDLAATSDIPVGGGTIFADQEVVVTQPTDGDFKCFTAICTHQGCIVSDVSDGTINCACHGSQYSIDDGSVVQGPATFPLDAEKISVSGGEISLA